MNISIPKINEKTITFPPAKELLKGIILIVLSRGGIFGMSPLGVAFAATFGVKSGYIALIGLCFGMVNMGASAIRYILTFFIYYILDYYKKIQGAKKGALTLGVLTAVFCGIELLFSGITAMGTVLLILEAVLTGGLYWIFTYLGGKSIISRLAQMIILGSVLNGVQGAVIPYANISISVFCAIFLALSFSYACRLSVAALMSGVLAFVMSIGSSNAISFFGAFSICAALGSMLSVYGKLGVGTGFLAGLCISALYSGTLAGTGVFDLFAPLIAFVVLPEHIHYKISGLINRQFEADFEEEAGENKIATQLKTVARAVCGLADGVTVIPERCVENKEEIFEKVRARVCTDCSLYETCKKQEKNKSKIEEIWKMMDTDGYCDLSNMPIGFGQICLRSERFLNEFSHVYELYKQNAISCGAAKSSRDIMARQYSEISNVIELLSKEIEAGEPAFDGTGRVISPKVTVRTEPKAGYSVSGDSVIYFEKENKFFVILCDGMGSGDDAMHQSRLTARLFEKFLKAGFDKGTSLRMINSALALKADQESFSTVDILEIDTVTGECEFLKIGSSQSFIKKKKEIGIISSKSLPVGILENIDAEPVRCKAEVGDIIVMVTDGVSEAGSGVLKSDWIKKLLLLEKRKPWEVADLIIEGAKARARFSDDMTCCVIKIEKRKEG
ncbi:MAG: SpoIIE family protein phosphatase [Clostridia bacterium]|nr:SpoIIE family protein phosphatase [Clostridia bacterium]